MLNKLLYVIGILLIATSCTKPEIVYQTEYKEVYIPVSCNISIPNRPTLDTNQKFITTVNTLLSYIENIEALLVFCTNNEVDHEISK